MRVGGLREVLRYRRSKGGQGARRMELMQIKNVECSCREGAREFSQVLKMKEKPTLMRLSYMLMRPESSAVTRGYFKGWWYWWWCWVIWDRRRLMRSWPQRRSFRSSVHCRSPDVGPRCMGRLIVIVLWCSSCRYCGPLSRGAEEEETWWWRWWWLIRLRVLKNAEKFDI